MNAKGNGMTLLPTTHVAVIEVGKRSRPNWLSCKIGCQIQFDTSGLESYCFSNWKPVIYDAFLIAAAVDFCDRYVKRPSLGWGREFEVKLPVHDPDRWSGQVSEKLAAALAVLTGDRWIFEFRHRDSVVSTPSQRNLEIPNTMSAILPFSEGLDSRITSALVEHQRGLKLIRVRLGSSNARRARNPKEKQPFVVVPYKVKPVGPYRFKENSARSRGFKFSILCGIAAYLSDVHEIVVPESGQGALGPALVPVGHSYEDYRNHPFFTAKMEEFFSMLFQHKVHFIFPRLWYTKGETLKEYADLTSDPWSDTRSCWQQSGQVSVNGRRRQCGICAACMLRRMSVHAAGLTESPETYVWENLSAQTFEEGAAAGFTSITKALREYAIAGSLHLDHLAALSSSPLHAGVVQRTARQIAPVLGHAPQDVEEKLCRLLHQHNLEWWNFIESLGADSFIAKWIPRRGNDAH